MRASQTPSKSATRRNGEQPPVKKWAYLSRFCNILQRPETNVSGLWLRRARVRVPSATLSIVGLVALGAPDAR